MEWLKYKFFANKILRETDKAFFIEVRQDYISYHRGGEKDGKGIWIPRKLATYNKKGGFFEAVIGSDFKIDLKNFEAKGFLVGKDEFNYFKILELSGKKEVMTPNLLIKEMNQNFEKEYKEVLKARESRVLSDKLQKAHYEQFKRKKKFEKESANMSEAQKERALKSLENGDKKIKELKREIYLKENNITRLEPIKNNSAIERNAKKEILALSNKVNQSVKYWCLAQFNKFNRNEINNISSALKVEFNALKKQWGKVANDFSKSYAKKFQKNIKNYVDSSYLKQNPDFSIKSLNSQSKDVLKSIYNQNVALIKTIPQEIIKRYESSFYNSVTSFDLKSLEKLAKSISDISKNRAKVIARDQTAKAIENFSMSRASQLGFEYYEWLTSEDERVSKGKGGHINLNKRIYRYDTPTAIIDSYGNKGHCGERVNCRCVSVAVFLKPNQEAKLIKDSINGDYYVIVEK